VLISARSLAAITGIPVPFYSLIDFFGSLAGRLRFCDFCGGFQLEAILLYQIIQNRLLPVLSKDIIKRMEMNVNHGLFK